MLDKNELIKLGLASYYENHRKLLDEAQATEPFSKELWNEISSEALIAAVAEMISACYNEPPCD